MTVQMIETRSRAYFVSYVWNGETRIRQHSTREYAVGFASWLLAHGAESVMIDGREARS